MSSPRPHLGLTQALITASLPVCLAVAVLLLLVIGASAMMAG